MADERERIQLVTIGGKLLARATCNHGVTRAEIRKELSGNRVVAISDPGPEVLRQAYNDELRARHSISDTLRSKLTELQAAHAELKATLAETFTNPVTPANPMPLLADDEAVHDEGFKIEELQGGELIAILHDDGEVHKAIVAQLTPKRVYLDIKGAKDPFVDHEAVLGLVVRPESN